VSRFGYDLPFQPTRIHVHGAYSVLKAFCFYAHVYNEARRPALWVFRPAPTRRLGKVNSLTATAQSSAISLIGFRQSTDDQSNLFIASKQNINDHRRSMGSSHRPQLPPLRG